MVAPCEWITGFTRVQSNLCRATVAGNELGRLIQVFTLCEILQHIFSENNNYVIHCQLDQFDVTLWQEKLWFQIVKNFLDPVLQ